MSIFQDISKAIKNITDIGGHIDTEKASEAIRKNIHFRGPNVWILGFSIVIASVGLNVNSTAVIIGAMLVSPLMGPIIGLGLGLGVNDFSLIKSAVKNLLVMVCISLIASSLYFLVSPLKLANPTELLARTTPSIYDVLIALFGGLAGILELSRREKGTVLSGVAIATALMPPLCTVGYGIATMRLNFILGAFFLFIINCIFITLATYIMVKYLKFKEVEFVNETLAKRTRRVSTAVILIVSALSVFTAVIMIRNNSFTQSVDTFVQENKLLSNGYIYDYKVQVHNGLSLKPGSAVIYITGGELTASEKSRLYDNALKLGLRREQIEFKEQIVGKEDDSYEKLLKGIYERSDTELGKKDAQIRILEEQLARMRKEEIPYVQVAREIVTQYPDIKGLSISRGAQIATDSLQSRPVMLIVATSEDELSTERSEKLTEWLKVRLNDSTVVVMNERP